MSERAPEAVPTVEIYKQQYAHFGPLDSHLSDHSIIAFAANQQQDYPKRTGVPLRLER